MSKELISAKQFMNLVCLFLIGNSIVYSPASMIAVAKQDAWLSALLGMGVAFLLIIFYLALYKQSPQKTLVEHCSEIFGSLLGKIIALSFLLFPLLNNAYSLWGVSSFVKIHLLPQTNYNVIVGLFALIIVVGSRCGLPTVARTAELLFPIVFWLLIIMLMFLIPTIEIDRLQPLLQHGWIPVLKGTYPYLGYPIMCLVLFLMIMPYVHKQKQKSAFFLGTFLSGMTIMIIVFFVITVLGLEVASIQNFVTYALARKINIGDFIQRLEVVLAFIWFMTQFFFIIISFQATIIGLSQIFGTKSHQLFTFPVIIVSIILANSAAPNTTSILELTNTAWTLFAANFSILLPLILLIGFWIKKRIKRSQASSNKA